MIALSLGLLGLIGSPVPLTSYRELGVLRRMATTPVPPSWLLGAQVVVNLALLAAAAFIVVLGSATVIQARLQLQPLGSVLSLILAVAPMFSLGLIPPSSGGGGGSPPHATLDGRRQDEPSKPVMTVSLGVFNQRATLYSREVQG